MTNDYSLSDVASVVRNTAVTNLIEQTKKEGKAVPDSMMDFYEYLHKRHICEYEKALRFQQMYKK